MENISLIGVITGLSSLLIVILSYILGLIVLRSFFRDPNPDTRKKTLMLAIGLMALGSNWLASSANFLLVIQLGNNIDPVLYIMLLGTALGVTGITWSYVAFSFFENPMIKGTGFVIAWGASVLSIVISLFLIPFNVITVSDVLTFNPTPEGIVLAEFKGIMLVIVIILLGIILILSPIFIYSGVQWKDVDIKVFIRGLFLGIGLLLFLVFSVGDAFLPADVVLLFVIRSGVLLSFVILFLGITVPEFLLTFFQ